MDAQPLTYWGESYAAQQHSTSAYRWQEQLGAKWTTREVWTRCDEAVKLPPRVTPLVAVPRCKRPVYSKLLSNLESSHRRVILRYAGEMNRHNTNPRAFVREWRKLYIRTRKTRIRLLWSVTGRSAIEGDAWRYWPGRHYTDYAGFSAFRWPGPPQPFARYRTPLRWLRSRRVRVILPELGVTRQLSDVARAAWLHAARRVLRRYHVRGVIYFNSHAPNGDWRLDGGPLATRAWKAMR